MPELRQPFGIKRSLPETDNAGAVTANDTNARVWFFNAAGNPVKGLASDTGEQHVVLHGEDSGSAIDPLLTSAEKVLYIESRDPGEYVQAQAMPGTNTTFYTNNNTGFLVDVEIEIVNNSSNSANATLDIVENGGSAGTGRRVLNAVPVSVNEVGIRLGCYTVEESGTIQGLSSSANDLTIHIYVKSKRRITA
jgi:hypothetical protein